MAIIKYYHLETRAKDAVSSLTASLQKRMLSEKAIAGLLSSHIEDTIEAEAKTIQEEEKQTHNAGEFQTLYRQTWQVSEGKRRLIRRNIPPKYCTELVVKGEAPDIMLLQGYLADSEFDVIGARTVSKAAISFTTAPCDRGATASFKEHAEKMIATEAPGLEANLAISKGLVYGISGTVIFDGPKSDSCKGTVSGDIEQVMRLMPVLRGMAETYTAIRSESMQFY